MGQRTTGTRHNEQQDRSVEPDSSAEDATWQALAGIPPAQRATIVARNYLDFTEAQAAALLGRSVGTVKSNTSRALTNLRARLGARGGVPARKREQP